jgi:nucleoside 2-deoxyribosyltransferase
MRVYLCGPINGCNDNEAVTWRRWFKDHKDREYFKRDSDMVFVDPMDRDYRGREDASYREIIDLDKRDIRSCDVMIIMFTKPSVGSSMEVLYAWTLGIPVIVINDQENPISPWLKYHSTSIVNNKVDALNKINQYNLDDQ